MDTFNEIVPAVDAFDEDAEPGLTQIITAPGAVLNDAARRLIHSLLADGLAEMAPGCPVPPVPAGWEG